MNNKYSILEISSKISHERPVIAFTGHRPNKIGGYKTPNPIYNYIVTELQKLLIEINPEKTISGMALGFDQLAAALCVKMEIPFIAAVPFPGQEKAWPEYSQEIYHELLSKAEQVVIVSPGPYHPKLMQIRNQFMIDRCDKVIACWDGTTGGTGNAVTYADSVGKEIIRIDPRNHSII